MGSLCENVRIITVKSVRMYYRDSRDDDDDYSRRSRVEDHSAVITDSTCKCSCHLEFNISFLFVAVGNPEAGFSVPYGVAAVTGGQRHDQRDG